jgi:rhodanese-related sulfurtransferase
VGHGARHLAARRSTTHFFNLLHAFTMNKLLLVALCAVSMAGAPAFADQKPETPKAISGAKIVSAAEAKSLSAGKGAVFIDTRSAVNFGKGRVPGAASASYKEKSDPVENFDGSKDSFDFDKLPADKSAKIVFYSDGPTGWKSYKAAVLAVKAGYKNVMYMRGGMGDWEAAGNPVER